MIMDVGLPDIDGHDAVRILRKKGFKAPIIMLTGHNTDSNTILGLESGADDYVTKPFRLAVLLARIRAQLRQHETSEDAIFRSILQTVGVIWRTKCILDHRFRPSLTDRMHRGQFRPAQIDHPRVQSAVSDDPLAHVGRIVRP
jgi:DNA-binding response OmpR family regulator